MSFGTTVRPPVSIFAIPISSMIPVVGSGAVFEVAVIGLAEWIGLFAPLPLQKIESVHVTVDVEIVSKSGNQHDRYATVIDERETDDSLRTFAKIPKGCSSAAAGGAELEGRRSSDPRGHWPEASRPVSAMAWHTCRPFAPAIAPPFGRKLSE
jgi:hypothetical protein